MNKIDSDKLELTQLIDVWRNRSGLKLKQVVARIQTRPDSEITMDSFQNRFTTKLGTMYKIEPNLTLAVMAAFTEDVNIKSERCTPKEAIKFAQLTKLPEDRFPELRALFPTSEEQEQFDKAWERILKEKRERIQRQIEAIEQRGHVVTSDGYIVPDESRLYPPQTAFNSDFLKALEPIGGAAKLNDPFYLERDVDGRIKLEIIRSGTTVTIRAPRQTGKTSLLMRGLYRAREAGLNVVFCDLQEVDSDCLASLEKFLHYLALFVCSELRLDVMEMQKSWQSSPLPPTFKLTNLMKGILDECKNPIVLAIDEADCLLRVDFHTNFFALVRSWHNKRAYGEQWNKLNIVMVISTEPHLFISDANQSPFNVGLELALEDFSKTQVRDLNQRHGSPVKENNIPQFMDLLNGHPYLTRQALYTMVTEKLIWNDLERKATDEQGPFGRHLQHHYHLLRNQPALKEALKQVIRNSSFSDDMALYRLLRAGLIKGSGEEYTCRCDLYKRYFKSRLKL